MDQQALEVLLKKVQEAEQQRQEAVQQRQEAVQQRQEAVQQRQEAVQQRQEAEQQRQLAEQRQQQAEQQVLPTTLPEFIHYCHVNLYSGMVVGAKGLSTTGGFTRPERKRRPLYIRSWDAFGTMQLETWEQIMGLEVMNRPHFQSKVTIRENGVPLAQRAIGSELDLHYFARVAVHDPVASIITVLSTNTAARRRFGLQGTVSFENHANILNDGLSASMSNLHLAGSTQPRRSPRLNPEHAHPLEALNPEHERPHEALPVMVPRADQICVYHTSRAGRTAAFIAEYKPPHKFTLDTIKMGLREMDVAEVLIERPDESHTTKCCRAVAAVITQTFAYMVAMGLAYGYIYTGEAFIFLHVGSDPRTVYYYLANPREQVGSSTGWTPTVNGSNKLHLTAVGQTLAFTLRALQTPRYDQAWTRRSNELPVWESVWEDIVNDLPEADDLDHSLFVPPSAADEDFLRSSPVRLRHRSMIQAPQQVEQRRRDSDEEPPPDAPSPSPVHPSLWPARAVAPDEPDATDTTARDISETGQQRCYCTAACLRGLCEGGALDRACPNVHIHGVETHRVNRTGFLRKLKKQLADSLDMDVHQTGLQGARGAFFQLTLSELGYTVAAKLYPQHYRAAIQHEEAIYRRLRPLQGVHIPVCVGSIQLAEAYRYDGLVQLTDVLVLSYAGDRLWCDALPLPPAALTALASEALASIHAEQVLHGDVALRNMVWDQARHRLAVIDFDRSTLLPRRAALSTASGNVGRTARDPTGKHLDALQVEHRRRQELGAVRREMQGTMIRVG